MMNPSIFAASVYLLFSGASYSASINLTWDPTLTGTDGQYSFWEQNGDTSLNASIYFGSSLDLSFSDSAWLYKGKTLELKDYFSIWSSFNSEFATPQEGTNAITWDDGVSMEFFINSTALSEEIKNSPLFAIIANGNDKSGSSQFSLVSFTKTDGSLLYWKDLNSSTLLDLFLTNQVEDIFNAQIVIGNLDSTTNNVRFEMATGAIPEPSTATLCLISLAGLMARRRRK